MTARFFTAQRLVTAFYAGGALLVLWAIVASFGYFVDPTIVILVACGGFIVLSSASLGLTVDRLVPWRRALLFTLACGVLLASVVLTQWPLRLSFALARSSFEQLADDLADGQALALPTQAGIFSVQRAEMRRDAACLWIGGTPAGLQGFVRQAGADPAPRVNYWWYQRCGGDWFAVKED